jgi:hypothetical protein
MDDRRTKLCGMTVSMKVPEPLRSQTVIEERASIHSHRELLRDCMTDYQPGTKVATAERAASVNKTISAVVRNGVMRGPLVASVATQRAGSRNWTFPAVMQVTQLSTCWPR